MANAINQSTVKNDFYASRVDSAAFKIARGPSVEVTGVTSFYVVFDESNSGKLNSSQETRQALFKSFKPAQCACKI